MDLEWHGARIDFTEKDGRIVGALDIPALEAKDASAELHVSEDKVLLVLEIPGEGRLELPANFDEGVLRSPIGGGWSSPAFQLIKTATVSAADLDGCTGWYEIEPEATVLVTRGSEGGLRFFNDASAGTLMPIARDRFALAYRDTQPSAPPIEVQFARDAAGSVSGLTFGEGEEKAEARRSRGPFSRLEHVSFRNGVIELTGLLLHPGGDALTPAVVFLAGTGYSTADRFYEMSLARSLLKKGIAVCLFDKRGCGSSTGEWRTSTLADLAGDAIAAARFLLGRKDVDEEAICLWGVSEGGWIAPLAASKCPELAGIINQGGPAVSPLEDELDDLTAGIESVGFEGEDLDIALTLARALVELYRSHDGVQAFEAALERARSRPWFERFQARIPQHEDDWRVQWWRRRQFDSQEAWKELRLPALILIGAEDQTMDVHKNVELFEAFRSSNELLELRIVPKADHGLRVDGEIADEAVDAASEWIKAASKS